MLKIAAILLGIFLLTFGILGTFPQITPENYLLGIFLTSKFYNILRIILGVFALLAAFNSSNTARNYLIAIGLFFAFLSTYGYLIGEGMLLGVLATNPASNWLTAGLALYALIFGLLIGKYSTTD